MYYSYNTMYIHTYTHYSLDCSHAVYHHKVLTQIIYVRYVLRMSILKSSLVVLSGCR
jgi:hypothetical protein